MKNKITKEDLKGEIKEFPLEIVQAMCDEQVKQGNEFDPTVFQKNKYAGVCMKGFGWDDSELGVAVWDSITRNHDFKKFYESLKLSVTEESVKKFREELIKSLKSIKKEVDVILNNKEGIKEEIRFSESISGLNYNELKNFIVNNNIPEDAIIMSGKYAKFQWYSERPLTKRELRHDAMLAANNFIYSKLKNLLINRNIQTTPHIFSSMKMVHLYERGEYEKIADEYVEYYKKILY